MSARSADPAVSHRLHHHEGQRTLAIRRHDEMATLAGGNGSPALFVEISVELAKEKGIKSGDQIFIKSARGQAEAIAMVTARLKPFTIDGKSRPSGRPSLAFRLGNFRDEDI